MSLTFGQEETIEAKSLARSGDSITFRGQGDNLGRVQKLNTIKMQPNQGQSSDDERNFLARLEGATSFQIKKKLEVGFKPEFPFIISDQEGNKMFSVESHYNMWCRLCFRNGYAFRLDFEDMSGDKLFTMERRHDCSCCCSLIRPDLIQVSTHDGQLVGKVLEASSFIYPRLKVVDSTGEKIFIIDGPLMPSFFVPCREDITFKVRSLDEKIVGNIIREKSSLGLELVSDMASYSITFASDLDPSMKILLLAGFFLINLKYLERVPEGHRLCSMLFGR